MAWFTPNECGLCGDEFILSRLQLSRGCFCFLNQSLNFLFHSFFCTHENNLVQNGNLSRTLSGTPEACPRHHRVWPEMSAATVLLINESNVDWIQAESICLSVCLCMTVCLSVSSSLPLLKTFIYLFCTFIMRVKIGSVCFVDGENDTENSHLGWGKHKHGEFPLNNMADKSMRLWSESWRHMVMMSNKTFYVVGGNHVAVMD